MMNYGTSLVIKLSNLKHNYELINRITHNKKMIFMVKANAYGHGMIELTNFCVEELNLKEFGVARISEAILLRNSLTNKNFDIFVFSDVDLFVKERLHYYADYRLIPVISSIDALSVFLENDEFKFIPLCLKFDTGMNRLGINVEDFNLVVNKLKTSKRDSIYHLMSHYSSSANDFKKSKNFFQISLNQYEKFKKLKENFRVEGIELKFTSMANSGAIIQNFYFDEDTHVRPGLIMYGASPIASLSKEIHWKGKVVSSLRGKILQKKLINKNSGVGYDATICPSDGVLVAVALGYGDGISRPFKNFRVKYKNFMGQIIGNVSMDITTILFGKEKFNEIDLGDDIVFWGDDPNEIDTLASHLDSIPYEIFTSFNNRLMRKFIN